MNLKTYKVKGLDMYITNVESKDIAIVLCLLNKIVVTENDLEETEFQVPENYIQYFMTFQEIHDIARNT